MESNFRSTGTTTVALKCKDCVVLATDRQGSIGSIKEKVTKIIQLDDHLAITTAGSAGHNQSLARHLKAEANLYKIKKNMPITVNALGTVISNIFFSQRYFPPIAVMILGGYDRNGPQILSLFPDGSAVDDEEYYATGSGTPVALGVLETLFKSDMSEKEGIEVAVKTINTAIKRESNTGFEADVAVIDKNGFRKIKL
ncbi:MAG: proteasome subunit beta [Candidatus Diapherotrites archaeon]|nr:proteasome subunit beta [Candidatus Diapherotrites archaeon]